MPNKTKLKLILGVVVTAIIIYCSVLVLNNLHMSVIFKSEINWFIAFLAVVVYIYSNYIRALAYTRGIDPEIDRMTALEIIGIGHALNMVLPLHAGEGMRIVFFPSSYTPLKRTKLVLITLFSDFIAVVIISLFTLPFASFTDPNLTKAVWILAIVCVAACIIFAVLVSVVPRIHRYIGEYWNISMIKMMVWVFLSWLLIVASIWLGLIAFGFGAFESISMSLAVFVATNIINLIPASPGAIGLFEYGTILGLGGLGVDSNTALSASLLLHLIQYAALLPLGAYLYIHALRGKYGDTLRSMWPGRKKEKSKETVKK